MSQLNLKQILSGDNISTVVEKINYNFNQLLLNGGGPQGIRGMIGVPGLPGTQGLQGETGPSGPAGTHVYAAAGSSPSGYPFGTGGEILPRIGDVFIETEPTSIKIYEKLTGTVSTDGWSLIETVSAPGGSNTVIKDGLQGASASLSSVSNDITTAGRAVFGTPEALLSDYFIDHTISTSSDLYKQSAFSNPQNFSDSLLTILGSQNQLRILDSSFMGGSGSADIQSQVGASGGGIVHSFGTNSGVKIYRIVNGDNYGYNHFMLKLNSAPGTLPSSIIADRLNRVGIGVDINPAFVSTLNVANNTVIGNAEFNPSAVFNDSKGLIVQGNLSIGKPKNAYAIGAFYNTTTIPGSTVLIDTDVFSNSSSLSTLRLGSNLYSNNESTSVGFNSWDIQLDGNNSPTNTQFRKLKFATKQYGLTASNSQFNTVPNLPYASRTTFSVGLTASGSSVSTQFGIDVIEPFSQFEAGLNAKPSARLGFSSVNNSTDPSTVGYMQTALGFNLYRSPVKDQWVRRNDSANNAGRTFWTSPTQGLALSTFSSTGSIDVYHTDLDIYNNTKFYISDSGSLTISDKANFDQNGSNASQYGNVSGLNILFGVTGSTGSGSSVNNWRRQMALFGNSKYVTGNPKGHPVIFATNGITQSIGTNILGAGATAQFVPHYTWQGSDTYGLYLSEGYNKWNTGGDSVGIAAGGYTGFLLTKTYSTEGRAGIFQAEPRARLHIGDTIVIHDGASKYLGYNLHYDSSISLDRRIIGNIGAGATPSGAATVNLGSRDRINPVGYTGSNGTGNLTTYQPLGGFISLEPWGLNAAGSTAGAPYSSGNTRRHVQVSMPPAGPTLSGWVNLTPNVPQLNIGLTTSLDTNAISTNTSYKRGTLHLAAQMRMKPASAAYPASAPFGIAIEDQYNLGLYSHDGYPTSAVFGSGGNPTTNTTKNFGINFLGGGGNVVGEDLPFLYATTDINLTNRWERRANFGQGFRIGMNDIPRSFGASTPLIEDFYDLATLTVGGFSEGIDNTKGSDSQAIYSNGTITIDQSRFDIKGDGGNGGLYFKDTKILTTLNNNTPFNAKHYRGDYGIQMWRVNEEEHGLNFWIPATSRSSGANGVLYLSCSGNVGIDTQTFSYTATSGSSELLSLTYQNGTPAAGYPGGVVYGTQPASTFRSKLAVNGFINCLGIRSTSDKRLKDEILKISSKDSLVAINKLNPILFSWKDTGEISSGFYAQEVQTVFPEAVKILDDENMEDGKRLTLDYTPIITNSANAIKELTTILQSKEEKIKNLEEKLSKIEELLAKHNIV